jgi:hypothetical protein
VHSLCRLIALPQYKRRAQQAAEAAAAPPAAVAAAAHSPATGLWNALANPPIGHILTEAKVLRHPPAQLQVLQSQWTKVLRRLQKAEEVCMRIMHTLLIRCYLHKFRKQLMC